MLRGAPAPPRRSEAGFTLIELMVVLLIIGILAAIAIPTYLGARNNAENTAAQSTLHNALTDMQIYYQQHGTFGGIDTAGLSAIEPAIHGVNPGTLSTGPNVVSFTLDSSAQVGFVTALSASGTCFVAAVLEEPAGAWYPNPFSHPGTWYGASPNDASNCYGSIVGAPGGWHTTWP